MGFENGKIVRVALHAQHGGDGDNQVNTLHYDLVDDHTTGGAANNPQSLADMFRDDVVPHFAALYGPAWTVLPVVVSEEKDPQNPDAPRQEWVSGSNVAGTKTGGGDELPRATNVVTTIKSDHVGRHATGRMFVGGTWLEADQVNGQWQPSAIDLVGQLINAIPGSPDIAEGPSASHAFWCIYSRTLRARDVSPYSFGVVSTIRRTPVRWLRSRQN